MQVIQGRPVRTALSLALPSGVLLLTVWLWHFAARSGVFPSSLFPSPLAVAEAFWAEVQSGRLVIDVTASIFRVLCGFILGVGVGVPVGLVLGRFRLLRDVCLPFVNFFRNLSTLAWIPFAVLWFGIGDLPVIFLIFLGTFFPLVLISVAAVSQVPRVFFHVARDYGIEGPRLFWKVLLPAVLPQIITALRMAAGLAWMIAVAAEMIAGRDGLGFAIQDARNGLRADLLVVEMVVIGLIGVAVDRVLRSLMELPSVRWGHER